MQHNCIIIYNPPYDTILRNSNVNILKVINSKRRFLISLNISSNALEIPPPHTHTHQKKKKQQQKSTFCSQFS